MLKFHQGTKVPGIQYISKICYIQGGKKLAKKVFTFSQTGVSNFCDAMELHKIISINLVFVVCDIHACHKAMII